MNAYIYETHEVAKKIARTAHKLGLDARVVGSVLICEHVVYEELRASTYAPRALMITREV